MWYILYSRVILLDFCNSNRFQSIAKKKQSNISLNVDVGMVCHYRQIQARKTFEKNLSNIQSCMLTQMGRIFVTKEDANIFYPPPPPPPSPKKKLQKGSFNHIMSIFMLQYNHWAKCFNPLSNTNFSACILPITKNDSFRDILKGKGNSSQRFHYPGILLCMYLFDILVSKW